MIHDDAHSEPDDELVDFGPPLQRFLAGDPHALETLPTRERTLAERLAPVLQSGRLPLDPDPEVTGSSQPAAPDHSGDPIAIALGLVPGPQDVLDSARFKSARQRSGLNIKDVAQRLTQRGWNIDVSQVLRWQRGTTELAPALIQAIAETLGTPPADVRARPGVMPSTSAAALLMDDEVIAAFLDDWARDVGVSAQDVRNKAQRTLASMNFRNQAAANREAVLSVLRALRRLSPDESP